MSKIENGALDQYGAEAFEQQQFVTAGVEGVNVSISRYPRRCTGAGRAGIGPGWSTIRSKFQKEKKQKHNKKQPVFCLS